MVCMTHGHWFDTPCLRCTEVVSPVEEDYVQPPLPAEKEDDWALPRFLRRLPSGGYMYPSLHPGSPNAFVAGLGWVETSRGTADLTRISDRDLLTALSDGAISCEGRQPIILEARRREDGKARRKLKENTIAQR